METYSKLQILVFLIMFLSRIPITNSTYGWQNDGKCSYTFHIWHPEDDVIQKIRDLDTKWTNVSSFIDREFLKIKHEALVELKQCQNWTSRLEREISGLKVQEVQDRIKERDIQRDMSSFQNKLDEVNKRVSHVQRKFSKIFRKQNQMDEMAQAPKAMPLIERDPDSDVAEILQASIGDMKAEWLLMKRDLVDLMNEIKIIKSEQDSFLKQTIDMSIAIQNLTHTLPSERLVNQIISKETGNFESKLELLENDMTEIKNRERNLVKDMLSIQENLKDILMKSENLRKKSDRITNDNAYLKNLVLTALKSKNVDSRVNAGTSDRQLEENNFIAADCQDVFNFGYRTSGIYQIKPDGAQQPDDVYCEFTNNTAYTVFHRRTDGLLRFDRLWLEYKYGFGNLYGEHWLGNEMIHLLSTQRKNVLRVDLWDWEGKRFYAEYHIFTIDGADDKYTLHVGEYQGNAGDSLGNHNDMKFSTEDMDNDLTTRSCATDNKGGWWFNSCFASNLNGVYHVGYYSHSQSAFSDGVVWYTLKDSDVYSLRKAEMKMRRIE